jgi:hypothetical protein
MDVVLVQIQDHVVEIKEEDGIVVKEDSWESGEHKGHLWSFSTGLR